MKEFTDDECIAIYETNIKGGKLLDSHRMAGFNTRQAESRATRKQNMADNLTRLKASVFAKVKRRQEKYDQTIQKHPGLQPGTALKQIFDKEKIVQENLGLLLKSWNGKKRKPDQESFALLHDLERFLKEPFLPDSGYMEVTA